MSPRVELTSEERIFYRDQLREARYAALADSEAFESICFAVESLGARLSGKKTNLNDYKNHLHSLSKKSSLYECLTKENPHFFSEFCVLFERLKSARNDAMHTGAFARNATAYSIEFCIMLEDAIMQSPSINNKDIETVANYMVKSPVIAELWHPLGYARQKMLANSFSYLPICIPENKEMKWKLLSDVNIIQCISNRSNTERNRLMTSKIADLIEKKEDSKPHLNLIPANTIDIKTKIKDLQIGSQNLWLITKDNNLVGVLSPFELL